MPFRGEKTCLVVTVAIVSSFISMLLSLTLVLKFVANDNVFIPEDNSVSS